MRFDRRILEDNNTQYVVIGKVRKEFANIFNTRCTNLLHRISDNEEIIIWKNRLKHADKHKDDFISEYEYEKCIEELEDIIDHPDYLAVHPNGQSISFIKKYSAHINVAVRVTSHGKLSFRTIYPLIDAMLTHYLDTNHAWKIKYDEDDNPI